MKNKIVYIVHAVDTEGPLYESLEAKFQRLDDVFNIKLPSSKNLLEKLKSKKINLKGKEDAVSTLLSNHLTNYNDTWKKIDLMIKNIFSKKFRNDDKDSFGGNWIFNWHCLDHVGYKYNPRKRTLGYHKIFDYYKKVLRKNKNYKDQIHWHFHPMSTYNDAHRCATSYVNSLELYQILCRRILERNWFPSVYRAGFQTERPDSNWFLEQWIPFDISNMSMINNKDIDSSIDFKNGRSGDWRRAPKDWSIYHPDHDDYQKKGNCRRWIGRALNVMNRIGSINQKEMDRAFFQANKNDPALVGFASHDFRDLETEVDHLRDMIKISSKKYPNVKFKYSEAKNAFVEIVKFKEKNKKIEKPIKLKVTFKKKTFSDVPYLTIKCVQGKVFGPQPFLSIKTKEKRYIHDNFDFSKNKQEWHYAFHGDTLPINDIEEVGVAANDRFGNTDIKRLKFKGHKTPKEF